MPNALRIGLLGPLLLRDETGRAVHVGGRQLRVLLILLALDAGRVVPAGSLADEMWPDDPPGNPGNALQTLVSRLRAELRRAGVRDVIESHPAGYRLAVPPDAVDVTAFEALAARGRGALAGGDAGEAARVLRDALLAWRGRPLADAAGSEFADVAAARLTELRASVLADRIEARRGQRGPGGADMPRARRDAAGHRAGRGLAAHADAPAQLAERLDDRFALLTGGSRTALPRQKTLRAVVDWSWNLLTDAERVLARRLAVFPGGATLAAAEQVCADVLPPQAGVLPALSGLVDKSIVTAAERPCGEGPRYGMLETVRAYGLERLAEAGEGDQVRDTFAAYYLDLAETGDAQLRGAGQRRWLLELAAEQDNMHAARRWAIARQDGDIALRFVLALGWYWQLRGQPGEPETLASQALVLPPRERSPRMAEARMVCALTAAGPMWDMDTVRPAVTAAIADFAEWSDHSLMIHPLAAMGEPMLALYDRDPDRALAIFDRYAESADPWVKAAVPLQRAAFDAMFGRLDEAEADCRAALAAFRELDDTWATAAALAQLGQFARLRADYETAIEYLLEAVSLGRELGAWGDLVHLGGLVAAVRLRMGDLAAARGTGRARNLPE